MASKDSDSIDLRDVATRLEKANHVAGRIATPHGPGGALLSGGVDSTIFAVDVKNVTRPYEDELDVLLRLKGHQGMQHESNLSRQGRIRPKRSDPAVATSSVKSKNSQDDSGAFQTTIGPLTADTVKDGSQAVQFFATADEQEECKVMFLNRATAQTGPARLDFRPYDLEVVGREHIQAEHFTITAAGVVHIHPGEPSQFIPLAGKGSNMLLPPPFSRCYDLFGVCPLIVCWRLLEWWRRSSSFNTLRMIPFFRNYLTTKSHRLW
jgi:hypothetical protein